MNKVIAIVVTVIALFSNVIVVKSQSCGLTSFNQTVIFAEPALETQVTHNYLLLGYIVNVVGSITAETPHLRYISGLRYNDRLEYYPGDLFKNFIATERQNTVSRHVTLNCADGGSKEYTFYFPIIDENNSPPNLSPSSMTLYINLPWPVEEPINQNDRITCTDLDFYADNADVTFTTSTNMVYAVGTPLWTDPNDSSRFKYDVKLYLQNEPMLGTTEFVLTANDGVNQRFMNVTLIIGIN